MIEIAEDTSNKQINEYVLELSDKLHNGNISLIFGIKCPTITIILCFCIILRKEKYNGTNNALWHFKDAQIIMNIDNLSGSR